MPPPSHVPSVANKELVEVARRSDLSVLRQRDYAGLSSESWMSDILKEMESRCPMMHKTGFPELELVEMNLGYRETTFVVTRLPQILKKEISSQNDCLLT